MSVSRTKRLQRVTVTRLSQCGVLPHVTIEIDVGRDEWNQRQKLSDDFAIQNVLSHANLTTTFQAADSDRACSPADRSESTIRN